MSTQPILTFRRARAEDRDAVFAMVATVWDGTDYIPNVWDTWLKATNGPMIVGVLGEQPVALCKITGLSEREDWLEGVRVDPEFRGRGFARSMIRYCIERSRERGKRTLRFDTSEKNETMQRLAAELGFTLCYAPQWYSAAAIVGQLPWRALSAERLPKLLADLEHSPLLKLTGGLYSYSWTAYEMNEARLREHLRKGSVVGMPGQRAWAIIEASRLGGFWIAHAEGANDELAELFYALRYSVEPFEEDAYIRLHVPADTPFIPALIKAGFTMGEHGANMYEFRLD